MLSFVPVTLDLYRTVRRHLHWTLQNLVGFADRTGRCFPPSAPSLPPRDSPAARCPAIWRNWPQEGVIARQRRPGGVYAYVIAARFLPAPRGVSHRRERGVPPARTEEQAGKKTGYARARFAKSGVSFGEIPDERAKWEARLRVLAASPASGCRCGVRSRPSRAASRRPRCCRAFSGAADPHPSAVRGDRRVPISKSPFVKKGPRTGKLCPPASTAAGASRARDGCRHPVRRIIQLPSRTAPRTRCSTIVCTSSSGRRALSTKEATLTGAGSSTRRRLPSSKRRG